MNRIQEWQAEGLPPRITELVYELLDAHDDTARLAEQHPLDERWRAHVSYLRDLQRVAREELAQLASIPDASTWEQRIR